MGERRSPEGKINDDRKQEFPGEKLHLKKKVHKTASEQTTCLFFFASAKEGSSQSPDLNHETHTKPQLLLLNMDYSQGGT